MLGLLSNVSIGKQSSNADPTTLPRQSLQIYSITGGQTESDSDDNILGGGLNNGSDPTLPAPGLDDHKITVKVPLCSNQFAWWCAAFFGTEAATGTTPDYLHDWKSGQTTPKIFLEHQLKSGLYRRHFGMVGESITVDLDAERDGYGMAEFTFVGLKETKATSALTGTVTAAPVLVRPAQKLVSIIYNSVAGGDLMGGKFTYTRPLKRYRSADGTGLAYDVDQEQASSFTGSIRTRYQDDTFWDDSVAKTERAMAFHLLTSASRGIKFAVPHARLSRTPVGVDNPGGIEMNFDFRGWQTSSDAALGVTVLNASATVAFT